MGSIRARSLGDNDRLDIRPYHSNRKAVVAIRCLEVSSNRSGLSAGSFSLLEITRAIGVWRQVRRMLMFGSVAQMIGLWMRGHPRGMPAWI